MRHRFPEASRLLSAAGLAAGLLLPACGGGTPSAPTPAASSQPAPAATPQPTPTPPSAANPGYPQSCQGLPAGTGTPGGCAKGTPDYFNRVRAAVDFAVGSTFVDPDSGETSDIVRDGKILSPKAYLAAIGGFLDRQGLCAAYDGEEISVREGSGYNENYDIITSDGRSWVNYAVTCQPALPLPPLPVTPSGPRDPACNLPPSSATFCFKDVSVHDGDVYAAQDDLIAEDRARATPQIFDFRDLISNTTYGYRLANESLYVSAMLDKLKARGYCARFDGDEFNVKRGTNTFSENFDLTRADGFAIRLYNATCRDAQF